MWENSFQSHHWFSISAMTATKECFCRVHSSETQFHETLYAVTGISFQGNLLPARIFSVLLTLLFFDSLIFILRRWKIYIYYVFNILFSTCTSATIKLVYRSTDFLFASKFLTCFCSGVLPTLKLYPLLRSLDWKIVLRMTGRLFVHKKLIIWIWTHMNSCWVSFTFGQMKLYIYEIHLLK